MAKCSDKFNYKNKIVHFLAPQCRMLSVQTRSSSWHNIGVAFSVVQNVLCQHDESVTNDMDVLCTCVCSK